MKKKTNQKIRGKKKRKTGNKKFSQALIGGALWGVDVLLILISENGTHSVKLSRL